MNKLSYPIFVLIVNLCVGLRPLLLQAAQAPSTPYQETHELGVGTIVTARHFARLDRCYNAKNELILKDDKQRTFHFNEEESERVVVFNAVSGGWIGNFMPDAPYWSRRDEAS